MTAERTIRGRRVRGLTLHRPWPWAFKHAGKRIENRSWAPPPSIIGGWLALHAGQRWDEESMFAMAAGDFGAAAKSVPQSELAHPSGVIEMLALCTGYFELRKGAEQSALFDRAEAVAPEPFAFGPYCWRTSEIITLAVPVECRGAQGLWTLPPDVFDHVAAQIQEAA
jgi:hypothetical protein